jgi:hypothetical protein
VSVEEDVLFGAGRLPMVGAVVDSVLHGPALERSADALQFTLFYSTSRVDVSSTSSNSGSVRVLPYHVPPVQGSGALGSKSVGRWPKLFRSEHEGPVDLEDLSPSHSAWMKSWQERGGPDGARVNWLREGSSDDVYVPKLPLSDSLAVVHSITTGSSE